MISEWMKVMLGEISRKKTEAEQARLDEESTVEQAAVDEQRREEPGTPPCSAPDRSRE